MFGKNAVTKQFAEDDKSLLVNDIFYTIQGEGPHAGRPAIFLRLAKCNLRCYFCDTEFEQYKKHENEYICKTIESIFEVSGMRDPLLVITGGEPFLQNFFPIIERMNEQGFTIQIETAGTVTLPHIGKYFSPYFGEPGNIIVCSPKTGRLNQDLVPFVNAWKYVVKAGEVSDVDGLPVCSSQIKGQNHPVARPPKGHNGSVWISPMDECDEAKNAANRITAARVCMQFGYRLSLQLHKLVGLP